MFLALKEINKEKRRFLLIISIVVLISYLVYFLTGLAYGLAIDNRTAVDQWEANKIILSKGSNDNISSSIIDQTDISQSLEGIEHEFINLTRSAAYINGNDSNENTVNITLIGMDPNSNSFPDIIEGNKINGYREAIASISLKEKEGLNVGDKLKITMNGKEFNIVGFTNDYKFNVTPVIYTNLEESSMASLISIPSDDDSHDSMDLQSNFSEKDLAKVSAALIFSDDTLLSLEEKYEISTISNFIDNIPGYFAQILTFGLMIGFLIVIAAIVLGVFLYIITIQKKEIFGIMKIQGISNRYIAISVIYQTLLISLIGLCIGLLLTLFTELLLPQSVPFKTNWIFLVVITLTILITSQIGAIFSVKSVANVDPLDVL